MMNEIPTVFSLIAHNALLQCSGAEIREEVLSWVTVIGSIAITVTTIGIQIYRLIRDVKKTKKDKENKNKGEK